MSSKVHIPVREYMDYPVQGTVELPAEYTGSAVRALILHMTVKPWTLDHLVLSYDSAASDGTIQFFKIPATVTVDNYLALGDSSVVALSAAIVLTSDAEVINLSGEGTNTNRDETFMALTEHQRRFDIGDRLVAILTDLAPSGAGSGSGADVDVGFENAAVGFLGRTRIL